MKINILRGLQQIGGCITEITSDSGTKILIDLGRNLPKGDTPTEDEFDDQATLDKILEGVSGIFYTHCHEDHIGHFHQIPDNIIQYCGKVSKIMMDLKMRRLHRDRLQILERFVLYDVAMPIKIGDITVTPYTVSHSVADAYMLLIECDGKRLLHTGDFRDHGYRGTGIYKVLEKYILVKPVDVLIIEATMLDRNDDETISLEEMSKKAEDLISRYRNVLVLTSMTDMDTIAAFHNANKRVGNKPFLCDAYQKKFINLFRWKYSVLDRKYNFNEACVLPGDSPLPANGFTALVRPGSPLVAQEMIQHLDMDETCLIYSMYPGYITPGDEAFNPGLQEFLDACDWKIEILHSSGHASRKCLARVCNMLNPATAVIPIHKNPDNDFSTLDIEPEIKTKIYTESVLFL